MVAIVLIHMVQSFYLARTNFPESSLGSLRLSAAHDAGMLSAGRCCAFDQECLLGLGIGASIASPRSHPRPAIVKLMLGGPIIAGHSVPILAFACVVIRDCLHWPRLHPFVDGAEIRYQRMAHCPGRVVRRATYKTIHELTKKDGAPFVPYAIWKDMFFAAF